MILKKNQQTTKSMHNYPEGKELKMSAMMHGATGENDSITYCIYPTCIETDRYVQTV